MSLIDDITDGAGSLFSAGIDYLKGEGIGSSLARVALIGAGVAAVNKMVNPSNSTPSIANSSEPDPGVRLQVNPDPSHKIPVVYGSAHLGGIITDAAITNNNTTMYYCITLCEHTGNLVSTGEQSKFTFNDVYWDDKRIVFKEDGITAAYMVDRDSNVDYSIADLVKVYFFQNQYKDTSPGYTITSWMANNAPIPHNNITVGTGNKTFYYYQGGTTFGSNNTLSKMLPGDPFRANSTVNSTQTLTGTVVSSNAQAITANITSYTGVAGSLMSTMYLESYVSQIPIYGSELTQRVRAYDIMPGWDSTYTMANLVYAIVRIDYNKEKGVTQIPNLRWHITNSMTLPGDCIYDYATSKRYGAGLTTAEIYT